MTIPSPCVDNCEIEPSTGLCRGCRRTLDEIAGWGGFSDPQRRAVLDRLGARKGEFDASDC